MDVHSLSFEVISPICPLEVVATIGGRPLWYRQRGARWELYETTHDALTAAETAGTLTTDDQDHLTGPGVSWVQSGRKFESEDDGDVWAALARMVTHGTPPNTYLYEATRGGLADEYWLDCDQSPVDTPYRVVEMSPADPIDLSPASPFWSTKTEPRECPSGPPIIGPTHAGKAELARIAGIVPGEFLKSLRFELNGNPYPTTYPHPWNPEIVVYQPPWPPTLPMGG